ncbi:MAG TPA: arsenate reductase (glutaredoxin) [Burkholderiaceae bacterium]|jgi:arsenate reductase
MITIYHNPRCSKSRDALTLVQQFADTNHLSLDIVDYQKTPLTLEQLSTLAQQLDAPVREMVRNNEEEYTELDLDKANDTALLEAIARHPKLLQRAIVVYRHRAVIARPPERVHDLLQG